MKKLRLKIWVEDENEKVISATQALGGLSALNPKNINTLEFDGDSTELELKILVNCVSNMVRAKTKNEIEYLELLKKERAELKNLGY